MDGAGESGALVEEGVLLSAVCSVDVEGELVVLLAFSGHESKFRFADGLGRRHLVAAILHGVERRLAGCEDLFTVPTVVVAIGSTFGLNEPEAVGRLGAFDIDSQGVEATFGRAVFGSHHIDEVGIAVFERTGSGALDHEAGERRDVLRHTIDITCEVGGDGLGVLTFGDAGVDRSVGAVVGDPVLTRTGVEEVDHLVCCRSTGEVEFLDVHRAGVGVGQDVHVLIVGGRGHTVHVEGEVAGIEFADEAIVRGFRLRDFVSLALRERTGGDVFPLLVGVGDIERTVVLAHPGAFEGQLIAVGSLDGRTEVLPGGVGLVAVAVERLGKHFDICLVVGVAGGLLDEEGTVGLAFFGLHDSVFGYAAIPEVRCSLNSVRS